VARAENIGVPAESEDVMLQAFYWDSYTATKYGRTKWVDLLKDTATINASFDLVWLPPSATSSGGVGYIPAQYSNQGDNGTAWGTKAKLTELIAALHKGNTKVIADIVINHRGNKSNWCDFWQDDFGQYGTYQLNSTHICYGDEGFTNTSSTCYGSTNRGAADTGTDFGGARDLDHSNSYVQNWAKAYTQWMLNVMKYDGFRYDMTLGYAGQYLSAYNVASQPYISVSEYWEGIERQLGHLEETGYNTMVFDFPLKYKLHDAIVGNHLGQLKNPSQSLRGNGKGKYAVTFIDNHDTFERSDNQGGEFYGYNADLSLGTVKAKILMANAYILMMPGIPCVFWPHWKSYTDEINRLIEIRKQVGIHSESQVLSEEGQGNNYEATIVGHRGRVILRLGTARSQTVPEGYELGVNGVFLYPYAVYVKMGAEGVESLREDAAMGAEKFIRDGQLYIRCGEKIYNTTGQLLK